MPSLKIIDNELYSLINEEERRQNNTVNLIASENYISQAVKDCMSSCLNNKYSEGQPGKRYYTGNKVIDKIELLCQTRSLTAFDLDETWGVNVQLYSGSGANFAIYTALCKPFDKIMGLDLVYDAHLSHKFLTKTKKISASSIFFESIPYKVDKKTERIDYDLLLKDVLLVRPKIIIAGTSCYPFCLDYKRFREIADNVGAYLLADISHIAGLISSKQIPSPFPYCDVVMTTTHKTLGGPRGAVIFYKNELKQQIDSAVFPGLQGSSHNHVIAAIATTMLETTTEKFKKIQELTIKNAKQLSISLSEAGFRVVGGGTETHLVLLDVASSGILGAEAEMILEHVSIICNRNTIPSDISFLQPSGIKLGTACISTLEFSSEDVKSLSMLIKDVLEVGSEISIKSKTIKDFESYLNNEYVDILKGFKKRTEYFTKSRKY